MVTKTDSLTQETYQEVVVAAGQFKKKYINCFSSFNRSIKIFRVRFRLRPRDLRVQRGRQRLAHGHLIPRVHGPRDLGALRNEVTVLAHLLRTTDLKLTVFPASYAFLKDNRFENNLFVAS